MKKVILVICLTLSCASVFASFPGHNPPRTSTTVPGGHGQTYSFNSDGTTTQTFQTPNGGSFSVNSDGSTQEQMPYYGGYNGSDY